MKHSEIHRTHRVGWLRAAVLGANDGIVSTASLVIGVAASGANRAAILIAGMAGLVAGAMSMAAGEYVSVSSQADTEAADLARERSELAADPAGELDELTGILEGRGVERGLAREVARQLTAADALGAHAREELAITQITTARPVQAALTSAITFTVGAALPMMVAAVFGASIRVWMVGSPRWCSSPASGWSGLGPGERRRDGPRSGWPSGAHWRWWSPRSSARRSAPSCERMGTGRGNGWQPVPWRPRALSSVGESASLTRKKSGVRVPQRPLHRWLFGCASSRCQPGPMPGRPWAFRVRRFAFCPVRPTGS